MNDSKHGRSRWFQNGLLAAAVATVVIVSLFHLFYAHRGSLVGILYLGALYVVGVFLSARQAFYFGLAVGVGVFVPKTLFLWKLFGPAAIVLWLLLAVWHGVFAALGRTADARFGSKWGLLAAPVLWTGVEYFRCEVWPLRFSWLSVGSAFDAGHGEAALVWAGVYGAGFLMMAFGALLLRGETFRGRLLWSALPLAAIWIWTFVVSPRPTMTPFRGTKMSVVGVQLEFPSVPDALQALDRGLALHTNADLFVLSEYTFDGGIPESISRWCKANRRWLVAGGHDELDGNEPGSALCQALVSGMFIRGQTYRNTAFVVDTNGVVVFKQAKAQPIQFFRDGIPASRQGVWQSPWGKIGIAICYDVSYRRVMDRLVQMGARALIVPAMDVVDWGQSEHLLNARQSRLRAAEYGLPIFRVASSGISQLITNRGRSESTASYPGQGEMLAGELPLADEPARAPLDVWLAPACCYATGLFVLFLIGERWVKGRSKCPSTEVL